MATILGVLAVMFMFDAPRKLAADHWNLIMLLIVLAPVFDRVYKWFWMRRSTMGKLAVMCAKERKEERDSFGEQISIANKIGKLNNDWSMWDAVNNRKHEQIYKQNIRLLNMWLEKELDREMVSENDMLAILDQIKRR